MRCPFGLTCPIGSLLGSGQQHPTGRGTATLKGVGGPVPKLWRTPSLWLLLIRGKTESEEISAHYPEKREMNIWVESKLRQDVLGHQSTADWGHQQYLILTQPYQYKFPGSVLQLITSIRQLRMNYLICWNSP